MAVAVSRVVNRSGLLWYAEGDLERARGGWVVRIWAVMVRKRDGSGDNTPRGKKYHPQQGNN